MRQHHRSIKPQAGFRLCAIGALALGVSACSSESARFSDPFGNPFQTAQAPRDPATTGSIGRGSAAVPRAPQLSQAAPVAPLRSVSSQPLPPPQSAVALRSAAPPTATLGSSSGWTGQGGSSVVVAQGETLDTLSGRYGVPRSALMQANGLSSPQVSPGTRITIPVFSAGGGTAATPRRTAELSPIASDVPPVTQRLALPPSPPSAVERARITAREAQARQEAEAKARAEARVKAEAEAKAQAHAKASAEAQSKVATEARLKASAEGKARAAAEAKAKVAAEAQTKAAAEAQAKSKAAADAKAMGEARAKFAAEAKAKAEAKARVTASAAPVPAPVKPVETRPVENKPVVAVKPVAEATKKPIVAAAPVVAAPAVTAVPKVEPKPEPQTTASLRAEPKEEDASTSGDFRWPARGRVIAGYGGKGGNEGINIAVPEGTPVKAAEGGTVAYAGSELKGYGNLVLIRHPNGYVSAYAHNGEIAVKRGETVKRGQVVAKSGQSGNVASPQLHFELRKGASPVDPMPYLNN